MAKYLKISGDKVEKALYDEMQERELKSGRSRVHTSREETAAIDWSRAGGEGNKVPRKKSSLKKSIGKRNHSHKFYRK